jgi:hypothetical protein
MNGVILTLREYWWQAIQPKSPLAKIIVPLILIKIIAILAIWGYFFGPSSKIEVGRSAIDQSVFHLTQSTSQEIPQ